MVNALDVKKASAAGARAKRMLFECKGVCNKCGFDQALSDGD